MSLFFIDFLMVDWSYYYILDYSMFFGLRILGFITGYFY